MSMKTEEYNREAWDQQVEQGNCWTIPVTSEQVERARQGDWIAFGITDRARQ